MAACSAAAATCLCPVRGQTGLSEATATRFPVLRTTKCDAFSETRRTKNRLLWYGICAVLKKASWGTRRIFRGTRCSKQASTVRKGHSVHENPLFLHGRRFQRNSVLKTGFYGTEEIFGAKNRLLWYATHLQRPTGRPTPQTVDSLLPHRTHLQCAKQPPLSLFAPAPSTISFVPLTRNLSPAAPSLAPSTALGTRNGPRSEVIRLKRGCIPWKSLRIPPPF